MPASPGSPRPLRGLHSRSPSRQPTPGSSRPSTIRRASSVPTMVGRAGPDRGEAGVQTSPAIRGARPGVVGLETMSSRRVFRLLLLAVAITFALGVPASVAAHAELVLASPQPGTGLAQAPAAVVIKFSEPLNVALSRIQVLDASGADVGQGSTQAVVGDPQAARRALGLLPTGQYTVRWTSVSARVVVLATTALGTFLAVRWVLVGGLLAAAAIVADAASGHAASSVQPPLAIASFSIHLAAVGVWTYAIVASLLAARDLRRALGTFTPFAVGAGIVVVVTGIVNAILELADPADLVETGYGLVLLAKSAAFVTMAGFGLLHYLLRRRPATSDARLRLHLRSEAMAATLALVLATLLVGFPNPPREAEATASSLTATDPVLAERGGRDALSIADASGPFVVGLTILPPKPGPAEIRVQVLGVDPGDGLRNARVSAGAGGAPVVVPLSQACGLGCFAGSATFGQAGDWHLKVEIDSNRGPITISETVPLPAPDGSAALARTLTAEEALKTALMTERLSGSVGGLTYVTTFKFEAPDKMEFTTNDATTIFDAQQQFRRTGSGPWAASPIGPPGFSWPTGYFRQFWGAMAAPRLIGTDTVDGVPTQVIAFLRPDVPAWLRVWVRQSNGIVLR